MKKYIHYFLILAISICFSCSKEDSPVVDPALPLTAVSLMNEAYGTESLQNMDVYLPPNRTTAATKVMLMIHGGGWTGGDKVDFNTYVDTLKKRLPDYAIININYRLSANPINIFPTQEMDVKKAVEFLKSKSAYYQISDKYVLLGASAGGHLAMLQGFKYQSPVKAQAIISFFGPSNLTEMYNNPIGGNPLYSVVLANSIGFTPAQNPSLYASSSPVNYINTSCMPTILLHGGNDQLVNPLQSEQVHNLLNAASVPNEYHFYPTAPHGTWDDPTFTDAVNKIMTFLNTYVP